MLTDYLCDGGLFRVDVGFLARLELPLFARGCAHDPVCPIPVLGAMVVDEIGRLLGESFVRPLDPWTQPLGEEALWRREDDLVHATHP